VFLIRSIFSAPLFLHARLGLLDPRAAAELGVAFFQGRCTRSPFVTPGIGSRSACEKLADLLGVLVRVASRATASNIGCCRLLALSVLKPLRTAEEAFEHAELEKNALDPSRQFGCQ
jgi:hypothetical protein